MFSLNIVLYEHSGNLFVFPVDVVGPFDADVVSKLVEGIFYRQGSYSGNNKLFDSLHLFWIDKQAEHQVLTFCRKPGCTRLSTSRGLILRYHQRSLFGMLFSGKPFQIKVGRINLIDPNSKAIFT